ncbi:MaoC family dehydratase [Rhizorhabdus wittichii]|uniref:MaoC family dehydratase n=1 Tax=Rhizorhabdus wittichii TaxID=160791 RepID=A0A975CZF7_9SPHN|nr:MaoC family dehydratase [Rhizorhabdus wittichii]QTH20064.1 MaoC family dehydratase [Rhizorhabdus wittichii]
MKWVVGAAIPALHIASVPTAGMKLVAALMNDPNPIHLDPAAVRALGLGDRLVNQGPITISYLQTMLARAVGDAGRIVSFKARFVANVFAGDRVDCVGTVDAVDGGAGLASILCQATVDGRPVVLATATIRLPRDDEA